MDQPKLDAAHDDIRRAQTDLDFLRDARGRVSDRLGEMANLYRAQRLDIIKGLIDGSDDPATRKRMLVIDQDYSLLADALIYLDHFQVPDGEVVLAQRSIDLLVLERDAMEADAKGQIAKMREAGAAIAAVNPGVILDTKGSMAQAKLDEVVKLSATILARKDELSARQTEMDADKQTILTKGFLGVGR